MSFFINFFKKATIEQRLISSQIAKEYKSDDADNAKEIMRQQVEAVDRMVPATVIFNLINIGILSLLLQGAVPDLQLFGWALFTTTISISAALVWWHNNFSDIENLDQIEAARRKLIAAAAARALIWGAAFVMFFPQVGPVHQIVIGLTAGGMLCAGAFGMSPMPRAAITYLGIVATSMIVALAHRYLGDVCGRRHDGDLLFVSCFNGSQSELLAYRPN